VYCSFSYDNYLIVLIMIYLAFVIYLYTYMGVQGARNLSCTCVGARGRLVALARLSRLLLLKVE